MGTLANRVKMTTSTTGTGTITLVDSVPGYQTFDQAGVPNGAVVSYTIEDGSLFEIGQGTYASGPKTMTRSVSQSSTGGAINLTGGAKVFISALASDLDFNPAASLAAFDAA